MNDSYDIPSEPRLSNELHLNRPIPQARSKMKQKKRTPPRPPDSPSSSVLGLDDTMPLEGNSNDSASFASIFIRSIRWK